MLPQGIDTRQRIEFISSQDKGEPKTVFILRPLSSLEKAVFSSMNDNDPKKGLCFYLTTAIVEIKDYVTDDILEAVMMLDDTTLGELLVKINEINNVTKQEVKN